MIFFFFIYFIIIQYYVYNNNKLFKVIYKLFFNENYKNDKLLKNNDMLNNILNKKI